jgi:hypothetical protein
MVLLEELESEQDWEKRFTESEDILDRLADEALEARAKVVWVPKMGI